MPPVRLAVLTAAATLLAAAPAPHPAVDDSGPLLRDAIVAGARVSYEGQISTIRSGRDRAYAIVEQIDHRAPDLTRRTYLAPQVLYGQYVVTRGARSWDVNPREHTVVVTENHAADDALGGSGRTTLLFANYRPVSGDDDMVADRRAHVIDLVNRYTGERTMRVWIDARTHVVLAKEEYHGDGSLAWRTRYDAIRFTGDIPVQLFVTTTPAGYRTVDGASYAQPDEDVARAIARCGFSPIEPKYLPEGFSVGGADLTTVHGVRNLHLVYSDGLRNLSLFENATGAAIDFTGMAVKTTAFEGHPAQYVQEGPTTLLAWREHGLAFALVGDLDLKDLVRIATSVVP